MIQYIAIKPETETVYEGTNGSSVRYNLLYQNARYYMVMYKFPVEKDEFGLARFVCSLQLLLKHSFQDVTLPCLGSFALLFRLSTQTFCLCLLRPNPEDA
jgi:hypothetical protein